MPYSDVSIAMATRNEEKAVGRVISDLRGVLGKAAEIVIVDSSTDRTPKIARSMGAKVLTQQPRGYGIAMRQSIMSATRPIVVTLDCDGTYPADAIPRMVELARKGMDVVSASRFKGRIRNMTPLNAAGNRMLALLASILFLRKITDITTGMRAYRRSNLHRFAWRENLSLPAELALRHITAGYSYLEMDISYSPRIGETKLDPLQGGVAFLKAILRMRIG